MKITVNVGNLLGKNGMQITVTVGNLLDKN